MAGGEEAADDRPVLSGDDERWAVRSAIDAVVADAYCLSRDQYAHVLSTFSHSSYRKAPELCLARFDELKQLGLETFTRKHDPYWDIPLNENLPQPVIDLPIPKDETAEQTDHGTWKSGAARSASSALALFLTRKRMSPPSAVRRNDPHLTGEQAMAHELNIENDRASMMYVGEVPWARVGNVPGRSLPRPPRRPSRRRTSTGKSGQAGVLHAGTNLLRDSR